VNDQIWNALTAALTVITVLLIARLAATYQRPRPISTAVEFLYLLGMPSALAAYTWFSGLVPPTAWIAVAVLLGAALGLWQASAAAVQVSNGQAFVHNAWWYLVAWLASFAIVQAIDLVSGDPAWSAPAACAIFMSTAMAWTARAAIWVIAARRVAEDRTSDRRTSAAASR
jgi:hypothetical protein